MHTVNYYFYCTYVHIVYLLAYFVHTYVHTINTCVHSTCVHTFLYMFMYLLTYVHTIIDMFKKNIFSDCCQCRYGLKMKRKTN